MVTSGGLRATLQRTAVYTCYHAPASSSSTETNAACRSASSSSSDRESSELEVDAHSSAEIEPQEEHDAAALEAWQDYKDAFKSLARIAHSSARRAAPEGGDRPQIDYSSLHAILRRAGYNMPFVAVAGHSVQAVAPAADLEALSYGNQDTVHGRVVVPHGPHITSVRIHVTARDQGWCDDPAGGSWTWGELAWASQADPEGGPGQNPRFEVYRNAVGVQAWQHHDTTVEGARLQALLDARPPKRAGEQSQLVFVIRSQFVGWHHAVRSVHINVEWDGVDSS